MKYYNSDDDTAFVCDGCGKIARGELWDGQLVYDDLGWYHINNGVDLCKQCASKLDAWNRKETANKLAQEAKEAKESGNEKKRVDAALKIYKINRDFWDELEELKKCNN